MVLPEGASIRIVIVDDSGLRATVLEEMLVVSRALARPIAMFVDQSDGAMIGAAIDAGVSAYVVDGLRKERVKPVLELAVRRWPSRMPMQCLISPAPWAGGPSRAPQQWRVLSSSVNGHRLRRY